MGEGPEAHSFLEIGKLSLRCLEPRFESRIARDSESLANRIARLETYLKSEKSKDLTATRTVFGLAIRIVQSEIAVHRWRFELLRTVNRDSRPLSTQAEAIPLPQTRKFKNLKKWCANMGQRCSSTPSGSVIATLELILVVKKARNCV